MNYEEIIILIPSHSLEDFPTEMNEREAEGLLNSFAVAWHPELLLSANQLPQWMRADDPPEIVNNRLIFLPQISKEWIPHLWLEKSRRNGAIILEGIADRQALIEAALAPLRTTAETDESLKEAGDSEEPADISAHDEHPIDPDLVADFLSLGMCNLQMELLARQMHHFGEADEVHIQQEAISAAKAAKAEDEMAARTHLTNCFETLRDLREQFYPLDSYLIDLCLVIPRLADEHLENRIKKDIPFNLIVSAEDLQTIESKSPELINQIEAGWSENRLDVCGGEYHEGPSAVLPIESVLWQFREGREVFQKLLNRLPTMWGRRRFGLSTLMPQLLSRSGYHSALHVLLDDGIYPDEEESKIQWEGSDGTVINAISRIPLSADSAGSFIRFSQRLAESMEQDQVAALMLAHWPEMQTVFLEDLHRMHRYSPVLGRFVTFRDYFEYEDGPGRLTMHQASEYLSPYILQTVARRLPDPLSQFTSHLQRRHQFDHALWSISVAEILKSMHLKDTLLQTEEAILERAAPDAEAEAISAACSMLENQAPTASRQLAELLLKNTNENQAGSLIINSLSFPRCVAVDLPDFQAPPPLGGPVKAVQFDDSHRLAVVELPGSGFVWLSESKQSGTQSNSHITLAEEYLLRNEFFEVYLNSTTGGIGKLKKYGRMPNQLSQQISYRFPKERNVVRDEERNSSEKTYYATMHCREMKILSTGPAVGEIETIGDIRDEETGTVLSTYRQVYRIWRGRPVLEIDITLDVSQMPEGDPWSHYYAMRFAWNSESAALTRSQQQGAHSFRGERIESPWYFEIADESTRTTILSCGNAFHRKTGPRMLDSLLITEGETCREFRFQIAIDQAYPMQEATNALTPVSIVNGITGPPKSGATGWFFHVDVKNVQITRILPLNQTDEGGEIQAPEASESAHPERGFGLRLIETEGRHRLVKLRCFRTPVSARQRNFSGETVAELDIVDDAVQIEINGHEICDVELRY